MPEPIGAPLRQLSPGRTPQTKWYGASTDFSRQLSILGRRFIANVLFLIVQMGCKWHFEQDAHHKAGQLPKEMREAFINTCLRLHSSSTVWQFEKLLDELRVRCCLSLRRRIFPTFHGPLWCKTFSLLTGVHPGVSSLEVLGDLVGGPKEYDLRSLQICQTPGGKSV